MSAAEGRFTVTRLQRDVDKISDDIDTMSMALDANDNIPVDTLVQINTIGYEIKTAFSRAAEKFDKMENTLNEMYIIFKRGEERAAINDKRIEQMTRRFAEHDIMAEYRCYK